MIQYLAGLDLGQSTDYTALAIGKVETDDAPNPSRLARIPAIDLVHLKRFALGTPYPAIVEAVAETMGSPELRPEGGKPPALVVDRTGVGRPVVDLFTAARLAIPVYGLTITGGEHARREGKSYSVPKKDLAASVQTGLQGGKLKVVAELKEADTLRRELLNFRVKITLATGNEQFAAWRESAHDDLVLAVAMLTWLASHPPAEQAVYTWQPKPALASLPTG